MAAKKEDSVLPLLASGKVARPKEWGGWHIKDLPTFASSLATKMGWRLISMDNMWTTVIKRKYIDPTPMDEWLRNPENKSPHASVVWKESLESFRIIEDGLG